MSQNEPSGSQRPQPRACNQCQKRKSKCTGETPCAFCAKTKRECIYEARPIRTPLTRKNLDAAELRCEQLTSLLKTLNPGINIDAALQGQPSFESPSQPSPHQPESSLSPPSQNVEGVSPDSSNDFEWHEEPLSGKDDQVHALRDGMALLSTNPSESGYLGSSAGSSMLQTISSLLSLSGRGPLDDPSRKQLTELIARRQRSDSGTLLREEYLGSSMVIDGLVDAYFMLYNTSYPILHRQIFRESYNRRDQISSSSTWHIIFYIVLAIGHWTLSVGDNQDDSPYYLEARSRLSTGMLESGTLVGVQIFLLMGNYIQKRDRPNTGYNMIGIAFRMALGLGLHREITATEEVRNTLGIEMRRRIWWILYMFDSGFSITMGRPTTASDSFIDVRLPQNVDDLHMTSQDVSSSLPSPVNFPTTYSAMIAQARLAVIANRIYNEFLASHISNAAISEELATIFEGQLRAWRDSLPLYFTAPNPPDWFAGPRASILWKEQNLRMMLWRGGQRSSKTPSENQVAVRNCLHVAIETVQSISTFCMGNDNLHQGISWYATYFLFQAVLVLDVRLLQAPQDNFAAIWRGSVEQARTCLSQLGTTNAAALRCIFVLDRIHNHHLGSSQPQHGGEGFAPNPLQIGVPDHTSGYTNEQTYLADPALQFFLDDPHVPNLFDGMSGFPSTQEQQNFDYVLGDFYANEDMDMTMTWPETQF